MGSLLSNSISAAPGAFKAAWTLVFPDQCPACRALVTTSGGLCGRCWRETPFIQGCACDLCGTPLPEGGVDGPHHCDLCRSLARPWTRGAAVLEYQGTARRLVLGFKHSDRLDLAPVFVDWLQRKALPLIEPDTLLIPVPIHRKRMFKRRYNQAAILSRLLARQLGNDHAPDALIRQRATPPMEGGFDARTENLSAAIAVSERWRPVLKDRPVLLIDDVMTSGATFHACTEALLSAGVPNVNVLALARAAQHA